jgi:hypothetical protein
MKSKLKTLVMSTVGIMTFISVSLIAIISTIITIFLGSIIIVVLAAYENKLL